LFGGTVTKVAVTDSSALIVTSQLPIPEQPLPDQPSNEDPDPVVAVNVTCVPLAKSCEQVEPQSMPAGELVTLPNPLPANATDSV
jgi:hypothetical protein